MKKSLTPRSFSEVGFTLIELLVVISIMLIFIGSTISQYNNYTEQTKLKNEAKKLVDVLELAKKKALSAELVGSCDNFTGYKVTLSTNNYSLIFCCNSGCSDPATVNTYAFNNANISNLTGAATLNFPPLMSDVNLTVGSIRLKNSAINTANKCIDISISAIGIVELDEMLVGC